MFNPLVSDLREIIDNSRLELDAMRGKKVFISGVAGFIGRYVYSVLKEYNNHNDSKIKLVGMDNLLVSGAYGEQFGGLKEESFHFINSDLSLARNEDLKQAQDCEIVVHAAGIASPAHYKKHPLKTIDVAINGCRNLLEICKETGGAFTFFSSSEIYGNPPKNELPIRESFKGNVSSTGPRACYDESKRLGETLCSVYSGELGVTARIIRPFNVYGPGMQKTDYRVMPNFAFNCLEGIDLEVYGAGSQTRTYCYTTDAISGFLKVIVNGQSGEAYNIGRDAEEISAVDLARVFKEITGAKSEIRVIDHPNSYPADEPDRRHPSIQKAREHLNYQPSVSLHEGVSRFWSFVK